MVIHILLLQMVLRLGALTTALSLPDSTEDVGAGTCVDVRGLAVACCYQPDAISGVGPCCPDTSSYSMDATCCADENGFPITCGPVATTCVSPEGEMVGCTCKCADGFNQDVGEAWTGYRSCISYDATRFYGPVGIIDAAGNCHTF